LEIIVETDCVLYVVGTELPYIIIVETDCVLSVVGTELLYIILFIFEVQPKSFFCCTIRQSTSHHFPYQNDERNVPLLILLLLFLFIVILILPLPLLLFGVQRVAAKQTCYTK
jgi:hypothetical protein